VEATFPIGGANGKAPVGLGALGALGGADWRTAPLKTVAEYSPQVAVARYYKIPFGPFIQNITAQFVNNVDTIGPFGLNNNTDRLALVSVVDQLVLHVDSPSLNAGQPLKPFIDWFFARQTGIQATLIIDGTPRWLAAPNFTPIDTLAAMITEAWPMGWVLNYTQAPKMQFTTAIPLLAVPTTVTVSFRMWQPTITRPMMAMTDMKAVEILVDKGVLTQDEAAQFQYT
jgi:hypothetical protein